MPENLVNRNRTYPAKKVLQIIAIIIIVFCMNKIHAESLDERLTNPTTQKEAIKELWEMKETAMPELKEMLKSQNKEIIMIALVRLHDLKNKEAVPEVTEILNKGDLELEMKKVAMQYLCLIKDKNVISVFKNRFNISKDVYERCYALEAMGYIVIPEDKEYQEVINILKEGIKDEFGLVRMEAVLQLSKFGDESGYQIAIQDTNDANTLVREKAIEVLGEMGIEEAMPIIEKGLQDSNVWVRIKAKIAKEKLELLETISPVTSSQSPVKEKRIKKMSRKAMLADKPMAKQKIAKLREILNSDKILDVKIWAVNEMLDMGEEGKKTAEEIIKNSEVGAYVVGKEMRRGIK